VNLERHVDLSPLPGKALGGADANPAADLPALPGIDRQSNAAAGKPPPPLPGAQRRVEPRMVIPIEEDVGYDLRGTVGGCWCLR